ncbi:MAG: hypothetical protein Q7O66_09550 [Dehalococcoidia bacterium]|nr:hypothetical protein [Dehalococcoidia bacterium]
MRHIRYLIILSVVLLLCLCVAGWLLQGFARPASAPAVVASTTQPNPTATVPAIKLATPTPPAGPVKPSPVPTPVKLTITEAEATTQVNKYLVSSGLPIDLQNVQIHFQNDRIQATANTRISRFVVPLTAQALVGIQAGELKVTVQTIDIGELGTPDALSQQIGNAIEKGLDQVLPKNPPLIFDSVSVANGLMTVVAHYK